MREPRDRYSLVMGRLLIVVAICGAAGLVVPLSCHGQSQALPLTERGARATEALMELPVRPLSGPSNVVAAQRMPALAMGFGPLAPPFRIAVAGVLGGRPEEQVCGVHATRVVTSVTGVKSGTIAPVEGLRDYSMRDDTTTVEKADPVTAYAGHRPLPTFVLGVLIAKRVQNAPKAVGLHAANISDCDQIIQPNAPKVQRDSTDLHSKRAIAILVPSVVFTAYAGGLIDHDAGGYRDSFRPLPDKQAHFLASVVLAKAVADGTSVKLGLATCLVAGLAWEAGQSRHHGHASSQDATYDAGGCLVGALWGRR
jgi:hypothetical protein